MTVRPGITHWQPRVMRHCAQGAAETFAIHEVYFGADDRVVSYTEDALSPHAPSVAALKAALHRLIESGEEVVSGDRSYRYSAEDIEEWLRCADLPPLDYADE